VNRRSITFTDVASFSQELRRAGADLKEPVVVINADSTVTHQAVVRVMDAARQAGYGQIAFAVEQSAK
jgi:biopolymer transport protein ExbD